MSWEHIGRISIITAGYVVAVLAIVPLVVLYGIAGSLGHSRRSACDVAAELFSLRWIN